MFIVADLDSLITRNEMFAANTMIIWFPIFPLVIEI